MAVFIRPSSLALPLRGSSSPGLGGECCAIDSPCAVLPGGSVLMCLLLSTAGQRQCRVVVACRPNRRLFVKTERGTRYAGPPLFPPFLFSPGRGRGGKAATKCKYGHRCARVRVFVLCAGRAVVLPAAGKKSTGPTGERRRHDATTATAAADPARCLPVLLLFRTRPWLRDTRRSASASFAFLFTAIQKSYGQWTTLGREAVREACHAASRRALV